MIANRKFRIGTLLSFTGTFLGFFLSWILKDPVPFTAVAPIAVGGKWWENIQERRGPVEHGGEDG